MIRNKLHEYFCSKSTKVNEWYREKLNGLHLPIYASFDIRDSGFKVSNVDANIFPAGFNNICPTDKESAVDLFAHYFSTHYPDDVKKILLITEEHTNNLYYWDNVYAIKTLIESAGKKVMVALPKRFDGYVNLKSAVGHEISVCAGYLDNPVVRDFAPDLIVSNNDFSDAHEEWARGITLPINPPRELGWYQRKKSRYFDHYNRLATEFANMNGFDPFLLTVRTQVNEKFELGDANSIAKLADQVDEMAEAIRKDYADRKIDQEPFVFVKNDSGTYGLAVIRVANGKEVREWNNKARKKMKAAKGGVDVQQVIVQEGIPSAVRADGVTAEPVIYMVGCDLAGGFLRTHAEKDATESLNSPGAVFKKLCVSDLQTSLTNSPLENVYGWSARLGLLAIAHEARDLNANFAKMK